MPNTRVIHQHRCIDLGMVVLNHLQYTDQYIVKGSGFLYFETLIYEINEFVYNIRRNALLLCHFVSSMAVVPYEIVFGADGSNGYIKLCLLFNPFYTIVLLLGHKFLDFFMTFFSLRIKTLEFRNDSFIVLLTKVYDFHEFPQCIAEQPLQYLGKCVESRTI